jgi:hypothetical protein
MVAGHEVRLARASDQFSGNCGFPFTGDNKLNQLIQKIDSLFNPGCNSFAMPNVQGAGSVGNGAPIEIFNTAPAAVVISSTTTTAVTMLASATLGNYMVCFGVDQTVVGSSCAANSTIQFNYIWQDPNAASAQTVSSGFVPLFTVTTNGTVGQVPMTSGPACFQIRAKAGTAIQYSTTMTLGGSCSPGPTIQVFPTLYAL